MGTFALYDFLAPLLVQKSEDEVSIIASLEISLLIDVHKKMEIMH